MLSGGLLNLPTKPVWGFPPMRYLPQTAKAFEFGIADLEESCKAGVHEREEESEVEALIKRGYLVSSAFTLW